MPALIALAFVLANTTFADEMKSLFDQWDANRDGTLSAQELDIQLIRTDIHGEQAAALGALKLASRGKTTKDTPLTKELVLSGSKKPIAFESMYRAALKKIANRKRDLFTDSRPALETIHQGRIGDCYLLAPLGAMVQRDPNSVARMFTVTSKGYDILFGDGMQIDVDGITDAELVLVSTTENTGLWLCYLEKAFGKLNAERKGKQLASLSDGAASGGSTKTALQILTGHQVKSLNLHPKKGEPAEVAKALRESLSSAFNDKRIVAASISTKQPKVPGLSQNHAYAILGYDPTNDTVTIWNPHGNNFKPKGDSGQTNGYVVQHGKFQMPIADVMSAFGSFHFEQTAFLSPAKKGKN